MSHHQTTASCIESLRVNGYIVTKPDTRPNSYHESRFVQLHDDLMGCLICWEGSCTEYAVAEDAEDVDIDHNDELSTAKLCLEHVLKRLSK